MFPYKVQELNVEELERKVTLDRQLVQLERLPISQTVREMIAYTEERVKEDRLIIGFADKGPNPFGEKKLCIVL